MAAPLNMPGLRERYGRVLVLPSDDRAALQLINVCHAAHCRHDNCTSPVCVVLKQVMVHVHTCTAQQSCTRCRQWILQYAMVHARHCRLARCPVPGCIRLKGRLGAASQAVSGAIARADHVAGPATYW